MWKKPKGFKFINEVSFQRADGERVWICQICNRRELWRHGWVWLGSLKLVDEGFIKTVLCPECGREKMELVVDA